MPYFCCHAKFFHGNILPILNFFISANVRFHSTCSTLSLHQISIHRSRGHVCAEVAFEAITTKRPRLALITLYACLRDSTSNIAMHIAMKPHVDNMWTGSLASKMAAIAPQILPWLHHRLSRDCIKPAAQVWPCSSHMQFESHGTWVT